MASIVCTAYTMEKVGANREVLMEDIDGIFSRILASGKSLLTLSSDELTEQMVRSFFQQSAVQLARLKMQSRVLHLDLDAERRLRENRRTNVDQLQLTHENLLYQRAHIQREIEKSKDLPTPNIDEVQREMGCSLGTTVFVENLDEINAQTIQTLQAEKEARTEMKRQLDALEKQHAKGAEELQRKRKYLDDIPDQVAKIRGTSKDLAEDLTAIVKEIQEKNKRRKLEIERAAVAEDTGSIDIQEGSLTNDDEEMQQTEDDTLKDIEMQVDEIDQVHPEGASSD